MEVQATFLFETFLVGKKAYSYATTNPLSHTPLSINSLHSHLHLSSFQRCLLLQTLAFSLHLH